MSPAVASSVQERKDHGALLLIFIKVAAPQYISSRQKYSLMNGETTCELLGCFGQLVCLRPTSLQTTQTTHVGRHAEQRPTRACSIKGIRSVLRRTHCLPSNDSSFAKLLGRASTLPRPHPLLDRPLRSSICQSDQVFHTLTST